MTNPDDDGPWRRDAPPRRPTIGFILWLALLAAVGLVVWQLASMFPGSLTSEFDQANLIQIIAVIAFVSSGLIFVRRVNVKETVRNVALWVGIAAVLILGLSYRDEIERIAMRVRSELVPGYALSTGENALTLTASADGHFYVFGQANGVQVRFLIDTGATDTVLSPSDAASLGIDVRALDFSRVYQTANGMGRGAPYTLDSLAVGPIAFQNMPVSINEAPMGSSLLGMTFLRRLSAFEIQGRQLILRP